MRINLSFHRTRLCFLTPTKDWNDRRVYQGWDCSNFYFNSSSRYFALKHETSPAGSVFYAEEFAGVHCEVDNVNYYVNIYACNVGIWAQEQHLTSNWSNSYKPLANVFISRMVNKGQILGWTWTILGNNMIIVIEYLWT